ncbi:MAG: patatin-like phospholipase family protein [Nitrososphaeraceae archaeon]|nr:patatin-like phospholipase family protein [Nitrososphaeraceae archaeon]
MSKDNNVPKIQRALVLQGGGALGAYDTGVFQALYEKISANRDGRPLFDIVAGTSSGAMNAAILVSNAVEKGWDYAANRLNEFWDYVSTDPYIQNIPGFGTWWNNLHIADPTAATEEAARRYYSAKQFMFTGVQNVFFPLLPIPDTKFFDPQNIWPVYSNRPLKDSLERYANFPVSTSSDLNQPRLLLVTVDVLEGAVVTFDSYPRVDGSRKSEYGEEYNTKLNSNGNNDNKTEHEFTIPYDDGIISDYAIASGSVPINYDYSKIMANRLIVDNQGNNREENVQRYFWDGGIASNTPLRELIQSHKDYWLDVKGKGKDDAIIPNLEVYIVDVWPTKEEIIPMDHDSVMDRNYDLLLSDKTDYDEKVADIVSDYIGFVSKLKGLADEAIDGITDGNKKKNLRTKLESIYKTPAKSSHRNGDNRIYQDLIQGRFDINVVRIERTDNADNDISSKLFDYSARTIKQLIGAGYADAIKVLK